MYFLHSNADTPLVDIISFLYFEKELLFLACHASVIYCNSDVAMKMLDPGTLHSGVTTADSIAVKKWHLGSG